MIGRGELLPWTGEGYDPWTLDDDGGSPGSP
jgi:hypothetical protein